MLEKTTDAKAHNSKTEEKNKQIIRNQIGDKNSKPQGYQHTADNFGNTERFAFRFHKRHLFDTGLLHYIPFRENV